MPNTYESTCPILGNLEPKNQTSSSSHISRPLVNRFGAQRNLCLNNVWGPSSINTKPLSIYIHVTHKIYTRTAESNQQKGQNQSRHYQLLNVVVGVFGWPLPEKKVIIKTSTHSVGKVVAEITITTLTNDDKMNGIYTIKPTLDFIWSSTCGWCRRCQGEPNAFMEII